MDCDSLQIPRLRVGIGPSKGQPEALDKWVLGRFSPTERDELDTVLDATCQVIRVYLHRGVEAASQVANAVTAREIVGRAVAKG